MVKFGPAGNSNSFYEQGGRHTYQAMEWVAAMGLTNFEYSCGKGVRMSAETAAKIKEQAVKHGIEISVHAPYYTNLANEDPAMREKTNGYVLASLRLVESLGGSRVVFHPGAYMKRPPADAMAIALPQMKRLMQEIDEANLSHLTVCPETLGKSAQLGSVEEIIALCKVDERIIPCIDFGHLYARSIGTFYSLADYNALLSRLANELGTERMRRIHIHFSRIEYTKAGEKMHHPYSNAVWGPDFGPLCEALAQVNSEATLICESDGTMAEDALLFQTMYRARNNAVQTGTDMVK